MISAEIVLARLAGAGIAATVEDGGIRLRHVPRDGAGLVGLVRDHKAELLEFFGRHSLPCELHVLCPSAPRSWSELGDCFDRRSTGIRRRRWWQAEAQRVVGRSVVIECGDNNTVMVCAAVLAQISGVTPITHRLKGFAS